MDILIAEDDENSRLVLAAALSGRGHRVRTAANGREALDMARAVPPELVVSDILMPELDGYALCRALRADPVLAGVPLVFYTATFTDRRDEELAYRLGADRFVLKPCDITQLLQILESVVHCPEGASAASPPLDMYAERLRSKLDKKVQELEAERLRLRDFAQAAADWFWETDTSLRIVYASDIARSLVGMHLDDLFALRHPAAMPGRDPAESVRERSGFRDVMIEWRQEGQARVMALSGRPWQALDGGFAGYRGAARDVSRQIEAEQSLRRLNTELDERVRERTASLREAFEELESFSYSVSHDLRAPLRSMAGFAALLQSEVEEILPAEHCTGARDHAQRIVRAALRMERLVDDLLELARVSRTPLHRREVDLSRMADGILASLAASASGAPVAVRVEPGLRVAGDPGLLHILFDNLLRNAWKFSARRDRPLIEVGQRSCGDEQVFYVRDNGVGFDMDHTGRLFHAFNRLHPEDGFEGTGIGLAIVQRIVRRHGGRIWAESAPDRGACFFFVLDGASRVAPG